MPITESKRKLFRYKTATFMKETGDAQSTLEKLLKAAVSKAPLVSNREHHAGGQEYRFLNYSGSHSSNQTTGLYGCEFLAYDKGSDQSTIKIDPKAKQLDVAAMVAKAGEEWLAGSVYFGAVENHVVIVQSQALRSNDLEKYINWLLVEKAKVLAPGNYVSLADHTPTKKIVKGVRGIEIAGPVTLQPVSGPKAGGESTKHAAFPVKLGGKAWDVIKAMFGDQMDLPTELNVDNLINAPHLEVKVFLKWKGRDHGEDMALMNSIAKNMSHVGEEFNYTVHTKTGPITRDDFKIEEPHNFGWSNGRPNFEDIFPKMAIWLARLAEEGKIDL